MVKINYFSFEIREVKVRRGTFFLKPYFEGMCKESRGRSNNVFFFLRSGKSLFLNSFLEEAIIFEGKGVKKISGGQVEIFCFEGWVGKLYSG